MYAKGMQTDRRSYPCFHNNMQKKASFSCSERFFLCVIISKYLLTSINTFSTIILQYQLTDAMIHGKHIVLLDHISPTEARATDHTTLEANTIIIIPTKFTYMYIYQQLLLHTHSVRRQVAWLYQPHARNPSWKFPCEPHF